MEFPLSKRTTFKKITSKQDINKQTEYGMKKGVNLVNM